MKITVLGSGRWGTFLACYHSQRNDVTLWGREGSRGFAQLQTQRKNQYLTLPDQLKLEPDLAKALAGAQVVIISISAQQLRDLCKRLAGMDLTGKTFILCMKGIEVEHRPAAEPGVPPGNFRPAAPGGVGGPRPCAGLHRRHPQLHGGGFR